MAADPRGLQSCRWPGSSSAWQVWLRVMRAAAGAAPGRGRFRPVEMRKREVLPDDRTVPMDDRMAGGGSGMALRLRRTSRTHAAGPDSCVQAASALRRAVRSWKRPILHGNRMLLRHDKTVLLDVCTVLHDERTILPRKRGNLPSARTCLRRKKTPPSHPGSAERSVPAHNELYSVKKPSSLWEIPRQQAA
jgi:hypothetical protein